MKLTQEELDAAFDPGGFGEERSQKLIEIINNVIELANPTSPLSVVRINFANGSSVEWGPGLYGKSKLNKPILNKC